MNRKSTVKRARSVQDQQLMREGIITVARKLFHESGVDQVSMRKIASDYGCSVGTLYLYFSNKKALLNELWMEDLHHLYVGALDVVNMELEPIVKLKKLSVAYILYWVAHPDHYKIGFGSVLEGENAGFENAEDQIDEYRLMLISVINEAKEKHQLRSDAPTEDILHTLVAVAHGVLSVHYSLSIIQHDPLAYADLVVDTILKGWQQ